MHTIAFLLLGWPTGHDPHTKHMHTVANKRWKRPDPEHRILTWCHPAKKARRACTHEPATASAHNIHRESVLQTITGAVHVAMLQPQPKCHRKTDNPKCTLMALSLRDCSPSNCMPLQTCPASRPSSKHNLQHPTPGVRTALH